MYNHVTHIAHLDEIDYAGWPPTPLPPPRLPSLRHIQDMRLIDQTENSFDHILRHSAVPTHTNKLNSSHFPFLRFFCLFFFIPLFRCGSSAVMVFYLFFSCIIFSCLAFFAWCNFSPAQTMMCGCECVIFAHVSRQNVVYIYLHNTKSQFNCMRYRVRARP